MEMKMKAVSTEIIKPASPTPKSLQKYQLSFLDQFQNTSFMPFVYLYQSNPIFSNSQRSDHLKKSLSQTLSRFYPLAGRLADSQLHVDCNDGGAPFLVAEADCDLSQVITDPDPKILHRFLPHNLTNESHDLCMAVQATYLRCGGLVVGLLITHKIGDASSSSFFANTWSAFARHGDGGGMPLPKFDAATYFPPQDISGFKFRSLTYKEELATKMFTFSAEKIAALRGRYSSGGKGQRPSRVEALSAFIWTQFISATDPAHKMCTVHNAVNIRNRVDPEFRFGNMVGGSVVKLAVGDGGAEFVRKAREARKAVSGADIVARLKKGENKLDFIIKGIEILRAVERGELLHFTFSSLCGIPLYEADFGWGKPDLVRTLGFSYKNSVYFVDAKTGGGVEALIQLTQQDMDKFQPHFDLELRRLMLKSNL